MRAAPPSRPRPTLRPRGPRDCQTRSRGARVRPPQKKTLVKLLAPAGRDAVALANSSTRSTRSPRMSVLVGPLFPNAGHFWRVGAFVNETPVRNDEAPKTVTLQGPWNDRRA